MVPLFEMRRLGVESGELEGQVLFDMLPLSSRQLGLRAWNSEDGWRYEVHLIRQEQLFML